jgi:hypothetical protein
MGLDIVLPVLTFLMEVCNTEFPFHPLMFIAHCFGGAGCLEGSLNRMMS